MGVSLKKDWATEQHIKKTLCQIPNYFHSRIMTTYENKFNHFGREREANLFMLDLQNDTSDFLMLDNEEIKIKAKKLALQNKKTMRESVLVAHWFYWIAFKPVITANIFGFSLWSSIEKHIDQYEYNAGLNFIKSHGLDKPIGTTHKGRKKRLSDKVWWKNQITKIRDRAFEELARNLRMVGKHMLYCSNATHNQQLARDKKSREIMERKEAVCEETGDTVNMLELLDGSIANPVNKFAEIYTVTKGFENYAKENGHLGAMFTLTIPGFKHANSKKFDGTTVRGGQGHLSGGWNRCTTAFKDNNIYPYGQRIVESHKDGTVHWHVGLFLPEEKIDQVISIIKDEFLRVAPNEKGAKKRRVDVVIEDPEKGLFSSYLFKYISKSLVAFGVGSDNEAPEQDAKDTMPRVKSWASRFGIRRIQQVGGASIGVWRELRRCKQELTGLLEEARVCAHAGDWKGYFELQGGHAKPKRQQPIQRLTAEKIDLETGEIMTNRYGEIITHVKGVKWNGVEIVTRDKTWIIKDIETGEEEKEDFVEKYIGIPAWEIEPEFNPDSFSSFYVDPDINDAPPSFKAEGDSLSRPWTIHSNSRIEN